MPKMLADLTGAEVVHHTRGGARLSEQLNPNTRLGSQPQAALQKEKWDYVVLQEMSHGPITSPKSFFSSVEQLCRQIRQTGRCPFCLPPGPTRGAEPSWRPRAGTTTRWSKLSEACHRAAGENNALIADVGWRFYELSDTWDLYATVIQAHKENQLWLEKSAKTQAFLAQKAVARHAGGPADGG